MLIKLKPIPVGSDYALIKLTHGKFAIVDAESYNWLNAHYWRAKKSHNCWYAARRKITNGKAKTILMHREITQCPKNKVVHHKNHNTLDNRHKNLEPMKRERHDNIKREIA